MTAVACQFYPHFAQPRIDQFAVEVGLQLKLQISYHPIRFVALCVCDVNILSGREPPRNSIPAKAWQIHSPLNDIHNALFWGLVFGVRFWQSTHHDATVERTVCEITGTPNTEPRKRRYTLTLIDDQHNMHITFSAVDYVTGKRGRVCVPLKRAALRFCFSAFNCLSGSVHYIIVAVVPISLISPSRSSVSTGDRTGSHFHKLRIESESF